MRSGLSVQILRAEKHFSELTTRAQLFKANDVVSKRFVKIYIEWYANMLKCFAEKMWVAFHIFFSKKYQNIGYWIH